MSKSNLDAIGHDVHRLRMAVDDPDGTARALLPVARKYGAAYQDSEVSEILNMCADRLHVASLWGVTRGLDAFAVIMQQEKESLQIMWTSNFRPVTGNTFVRFGTCIYLGGGRKDHTFKKLWSRPETDKVKEHVVIDAATKKIVFRSLTLEWQILTF